MIRPLSASVIRPDWAHRVVAPAYDSVSEVERARIVETNPDSFLTVTRSPGDFPPESRPEPAELAEQCARALKRLTGLGAFDPQPPGSLFVNRLEIEGRVQTGLIAEVPVSDYLDGKVVKHEDIHISRAEVLARHLSVVRASSSPIAMTYTDQPLVDELIEAHMDTDPLLDFTSDDGLRQIVWRISDAGLVERLSGLMNDVRLYIVDGHHRAAAQSVAADLVGTDASRHMLAALVPDHQLHVFEFNRLVYGPLELPPTDLLELLERRFRITRMDPPGSPVVPDRKGVLGLHLEYCWYRLELRNSTGTAGDPLSSLDTSIVQSEILAPLGIDENRRDPRLQYVAGSAGLEALLRDCGPGDLAITVFPTSVDDLMEVADAGQTMPPKSTYFHPKFRSGVFLRHI